jgi:glutamyl-tRNA reductase
MPAVLNGVEWQTCLRRILFLNARDNHDILEAIETEGLLPPIVEVFRGEQAYGFLLEVICGLNSPIVGETAVMGQFKEFLQNAKLPNTSWGNFLRRLAHATSARSRQPIVRQSGAAAGKGIAHGRGDWIG